MIVSHLIERYKSDINQSLGFADQLVDKLFRQRLTSLVANWLRVGYCQVILMNCAAGGFTLDYGPFGFCENLTLGFNLGLVAALFILQSAHCSRSIITCFGKQ